MMKGEKLIKANDPGTILAGVIIRASYSEIACLEGSRNLGNDHIPGRISKTWE